MQPAGVGAAPVLRSVSEKLPADVQSRLAEAEQTAKSNAERVRFALAPRWPQLQARLRAIAQGRGPRSARIIALVKVADEVAAAARPYTACRRGCTHCCHIPVTVSQTEAELIGRAIGRPARKLPPRTYAPRQDYGYDTPCPFLVGAECSVYAHRPLVCRLHLNMDRDDLLCRLLPGQTVPVPYLNTLSVQYAYVELTGNDAVADIREFFPRETSRG